MHRQTLTFAAALALLAGTATSQPGAISKWRPSNTGLPGVQLHMSTIAPDGTVWVAGRWPFWGEGGLGIYDPTTDLWTTLSNVDTPVPSQWVNEVVWDASGAAWMATDGGLVRKDGENWTIWNTSNAPFFHNQIDDVAIAPNGDVWVNNSGVQQSSHAILRFDGQTWTRYVVGQDIPFAPPWNELSEVLITGDGHIWVANTVLNGVAEFDGQSWTLRGDDIGRFGHGLVDPNGDLWFVAGIGGGQQFWRYQRAVNVWDRFSPANTPFVNTTITRLGIDPQGRVHCGNWIGQVIRFNGISFDQVANVGDAVYGIAVDDVGEFWIATVGNGQTGNLHHLDSAGAPLRRFNTWNTGVPDYFIEKFDVDRDGNLWMASGEAGLSRFDGQRWRNWGDHNVGSEPYPFAGNEPMGAFYLDSVGRGWMGGNGIAQWDPNTGQFPGFWNWLNNPTLGVTLVTSFAEDTAGTIFASTTYGLTYRFNGAFWQQEPTSPGSYTSTYAGVKSDAHGHVWAMGWLRAYRWDGNVWSEVGQNWNIFDLGGINDYAFAPDGSLWIATNKGLLHVMDPPNGATTLYTPANSPLPAIQVQAVDVRHDGLIAASSHEFRSVTPFPSGVAVIDGDPAAPANWTIYSYAQGQIPHYQLGDVGFDAAGNLWISAISEGAVRIQLAPEPCYPDCDTQSGAGVLDIFDFLCFGNRFHAGDPYACDCDTASGPGVCDIFDFLCFGNRFHAGCE